MEKLYKFKTGGKILFIAAGIICLITIIGAPFALIFFYMAAKAKIVMADRSMIYKMLTTKTIAYSKITKIRLARPVSSTYYAMNAGNPGIMVSFATVIPLIIEWDGRKTKISANFFENAEEIVQTLEEKTGLKLEVEQ